VELRIEELDEIIKEDLEKLEDLKERLREFQLTEKYNRFGIMEESILTIGIVEARDLKPQGKIGMGGGLANPYVVV
jgi:hypothetical protein